MQKAFTLIELLVVVLIVGILAAVALPQYRKAVLKSRAMEMLIIGRSIKKAQQVYRMANGKYAEDLQELDVQMPCSFLEYTGESTSVSSQIVCPHTYGYVYDKFVSLYLTGGGGFWINFRYDPSESDICSEGTSFSPAGLCATLGAVYNRTDEDGTRRYYF